MRLTIQQKDDIIQMKRTGIGYKGIASRTGLKTTTVRAVCTRSGKFADNPDHAAMFSIPGNSFSTALAMVKPLPVQKKVTGNKQTDAYLWVLEVIQLNEPAHLAAAEDALRKLTISPKEAQERYREWMMSNDADVFSLAFGTMFLDNPQHFIDKAKTSIEKASQVRTQYGSYEAAMEPVEAERLIATSALAVESTYGMTTQEIKEGVSGDRYFDLEDARVKTRDGFSDVLPSPHTLSDVVRELEYWHWLYTVRLSASGELGISFTEHSEEVHDREEWLNEKLRTIRPLDQREALSVLKWLLQCERHESREEIDDILINLIGGKIEGAEGR
ncbi:TPA: helix-turn-helix domain-containing protein [Kluyvera intermedia]|nr:helix-turn-helix domain-containing protein [Kluyvera intermedia]